METKRFEGYNLVSKLMAPMAIGFVGMLAGAASFLYFEESGVQIGVAVLVGTALIDMALTVWAVRFADCPRCGRRLTRSQAETAVFPCERCGVNWSVQAAGRS